MTALEVNFRTARICELDLEILPGILDVPDIVDLAGGERRDGVVTGLRALLLALLEDCIRCYLSSKQKLRADAERWIEGRQRGVPVTFEDVCASFGLEPSATRRALRSMRRREIAAKDFGRARPNVRRHAVLKLRRRGQAQQNRIAESV